MFKINMVKNQKGIAHILVIIVLVIGLLGGLYLVSHPTVFKPKADTNGSQCSSTLAVFSASNACQLSGRNGSGSGFTTIDYRCNLNGAGNHTIKTGDCQTEDAWRVYAESQCSSLCTTTNTPPPPPATSTSETLAPDTCDISFNNAALEGQTISGNAQIVATANKSSTSNYLSVWVNSDKQGGLFQVGSTQTNNLNVTINTSAIFSNGPAAIECRIQTTQAGGVNTTPVYGKRIPVTVSNTTAQVPAATYTCGIDGPSTVNPGQVVTFTDSSTSSAAGQPIDRWAWGSLVGDPAISWIDTSRTFNWTAPTTPGVYPDAVNHSIHVANIPNGPQNVWTTSCMKTITVAGTQEWHYCAREGSTSIINGQTVGALCSFTGTATVRYGREPVWYTKNGVQGQIACNSQTFGYPPNLPNDPNDQKVKHCEYKLE